MTVVVIVGIFAAIAAPRYTASLARYRAEAAARRVAADLAYVSQAARAASQPRSVVFDVAANVYQVVGVLPAGGGTGLYAVSLAQEPYRCRIVSADLGGDPQVVFSGFGLPDSDGKITVQSGSATYSVRVTRDSGQIEVVRGS